ncbi:hypothetical protein SUNI508_09474 [Seiridium unicorne]|uniref:C2H2-type domain-containing protein n=1 Tax=Seiridium unicorne TaxID=138068 RepID=A0ABR2UQF7_9PEZI
MRKRIPRNPERSAGTISSGRLPQMQRPQHRGRQPTIDPPQNGKTKEGFPEDNLKQEVLDAQYIIPGQSTDSAHFSTAANSSQLSSNENFIPTSHTDQTAWGIYHDDGYFYSPGVYDAQCTADESSQMMIDQSLLTTQEDMHCFPLSVTHELMKDDFPGEVFNQMSATDMIRALSLMDGGCLKMEDEGTLQFEFHNLDELYQPQTSGPSSAKKINFTPESSPSSEGDIRMDEEIKTEPNGRILGCSTSFETQENRTIRERKPTRASQYPARAVVSSNHGQASQSSSGEYNGTAWDTQAFSGTFRPSKKRKLQHSDSLSLAKDKPKTSRLLACPFYKWNCQVYGDCFRYELRRPKDVRQHLYRKHMQPQFYCPVCYKTLRNTESRDIHVQKRACVPADGSSGFNGVSEDQKIRLTDYVCGTKPVEEQWYDIWDIIFGGTVQPPQSCYLGNYLEQPMKQLQNYWVTRRSEIIHSAAARMNRVVSEEDISLSNSIISILLGCFRGDAHTVFRKTEERVEPMLNTIEQREAMEGNLHHLPYNNSNSEISVSSDMIRDTMRDGGAAYEPVESLIDAYDCGFDELQDGDRWLIDPYFLGGIGEAFSSDSFDYSKS